uniref:Uncharacterized protein n=1 Tax=Setaria viridis TaxID=4556 RepID=A0A4U6UBF7_SETVI|nr:hypothetical protein SEVIR_5G041400v2 [Setaria viridis]
MEDLPMSSVSERGYDGTNARASLCSMNRPTSASDVTTFADPNRCDRNTELPCRRRRLPTKGLRAGRVGAGHEVQSLAHQRPPEAAAPARRLLLAPGPSPARERRPPSGGGGAAASLPSALTLPTSDCYRRLALRPHTAAAPRPGVNPRAVPCRARAAPRRSPTAPLLPPAREPRELLLFVLLRQLLGVQQAGREVHRGRASCDGGASPGEGAARGDRWV